MGLPSSMADFVPRDRQLQKAYSLKTEQLPVRRLKQRSSGIIYLILCFFSLWKMMTRSLQLNFANFPVTFLVSRELLLQRLCTASCEIKLPSRTAPFKHSKRQLQSSLLTVVNLTSSSYLVQLDFCKWESSYVLSRLLFTQGLVVVQCTGSRTVC